MTPRALAGPDLLHARIETAERPRQSASAGTGKGVKKVRAVTPRRSLANPGGAQLDLLDSSNAKPRRHRRNDPPTSRQRPIGGHARWAWCLSTCLLSPSTPRALATAEWRLCFERQEGRGGQSPKERINAMLQEGRVIPRPCSTSTHEGATPRADFAGRTGCNDFDPTRPRRSLDTPISLTQSSQLHR